MKKPTFYLKFWTMGDFDGKRRLKGDQFWPCETLVSFRRPTFWPRTNDQLFKYTYISNYLNYLSQYWRFLVLFPDYKLLCSFMIVFHCNHILWRLLSGVLPAKSQNAVLLLYSINFLCAVSKLKPKQYILS